MTWAVKGKDPLAKRAEGPKNEKKRGFLHSEEYFLENGAGRRKFNATCPGSAMV